MSAPVVVVLDSNQRSALAATRSLGQRGITVVNGDTVQRTLAGVCRFSAERFVYPDPRSYTEEFLRKLQSIAGKHDEVVLLPMTDLTVSIVIQNKQMFANARIPFPDFETFDSLTDKSRLVAWAGQSDLQVPVGKLLTDPVEAAQIGRLLGYPLVVKPIKSEFNCSGVWRRSQVSVVHSISELQGCVDRHFEAGTQPLLLQEYVPGHGAGIFALYDQGTAIGFYAHRRVREKPPSGGVSVLSESVLPDDNLLCESKRLLDTATWHGAAMVEYRITPDGTPYLMEVNGRLWGSLQLAISAGFDFPYMLYQIALELDYEEPKANTAIRNRWLLGDLDHLLLSCRDYYRSRQPTARYIRLFRDFLNVERKAQNFEVLDWRDLRPFLLELSRYVTDLFRRKSS